MVVVSVGDLNEALPEDAKLSSLSWLQWIRVLFDPFFFIIRKASLMLLGGDHFGWLVEGVSLEVHKGKIVTLLSWPITPCFHL